MSDENEQRLSSFIKTDKRKILSEKLLPLPANCSIIVIGLNAYYHNSKRQGKDKGKTMARNEYIIDKNNLYFAVKAINRLPDRYDNQHNGYYKTLTDAELKTLKDKGIIRD